MWFQDLNDQLKSLKMELDKKQDVNPEEIAALRNKNFRLKSAVEELQQDFEKQKETRENELDSLREENRVLLTKMKAMESQVSFRTGPLNRNDTVKPLQEIYHKCFKLLFHPRYWFQATIKKEVSPLVSECNSIEEMVDKLESEKLEAVNGNKDEEQRKKVTELEKVWICRVELSSDLDIRHRVVTWDWEWETVIKN